MLGRVVEQDDAARLYPVEHAPCDLVRGDAFVNDVMTMADYQELIKETADFIEGNHQCTESDVLEFLASFVTVVMVEE